ncbi:MAG: hemolysin III family protein [Candidatus Improbicoccus devescovinae]|nr:MAG: hemolysin III family protein [Candidatus Improbicoccus devescovinae]
MKNYKFELPKYTFPEEIINSITHGLGALLGIFGVISLIKKNYLNSKNLTCFLIYGFSLILLYLISSIYHALKPGIFKSIFRKFDHCSIFLLIAGTYTPISIIILKGKLIMILLGLIWLISIVGIILNAINVNKFSKFSLICYISMGWILIFQVKPLVQSLSQVQLTCLLAGGLFYTIGAGIYILGKRIKFMHSIWHVFVLFGSALHFIMFQIN